MQDYAGTFPLRSSIEEYGHSQAKLIEALGLGEQAQSSPDHSTLTSGREAEGDSAARGGWITRADLEAVDRSPIVESIRTLVDEARGRSAARPQRLQRAEHEVEVWNGCEDRQRRHFAKPEEVADGDL